MALFEKGSRGRPKGSKNTKTILIEEMATKFEKHPFQILMMMAHGDWKGLGYEAECYFSEKPDGAVKMGYVISPEMRLQAAKEACQYVSSKKPAMVDVGGEGIRIVVEDYGKSGTTPPKN